MVEPELVERMERFVRQCAARYTPESVSEAHASVADLVADATEIVALLPKPFDPDVAEVRALFAAAFPDDRPSNGMDGIARAREIANEVTRFGTDSMSYWEARVALAALKRGRSLALSATGSEGEIARG